MPRTVCSPCQFSAPHLDFVARTESVVGTTGGQCGCQHLPSAGNLATLCWHHSPHCRLPASHSSPAGQKYKSLLTPHASRPSSISTGSSQPAIGYLATVSSSPPALSSQPPLFLSLHILRSHLLLGASRPITNTYSATSEYLFSPTCQSHIFSNICQILINIYSASFPHKKS